MRPTGPMWIPEQGDPQEGKESSHLHICPGACDNPQWPPAPQEKKLRFSRVADIASLSPLRTFCPRVFGINQHFSQKSALQRAQIRAPDWTYVDPRAGRSARGQRELTSTYMPWSVATILFDPPLRRKRASLSPASLSPDRQESSRFCPRVLGHLHRIPM